MALGQAGNSSVPKASPELLLENDYVRVFRQTVESGAVPTYDRSRDSVVVALGGEAKEARAEVTFVSRGPKSPMLPATAPYTALVIELKQHRGAAARSCDASSVCSRKITAGGVEIGETRFLFGNGFVSAYRHHLVPGGTLDSSYYSAKGTNRILVVALTDLHVNLGGIDHTLAPGQVYFSDRTEAEVNAVGQEATWVVVRFLTQK